MKRTTPTVLLIVVAALTLFIWFYEKSPRVTVTQSKRKLFPIRAAEISKIELRQERDTIVLEKINGQWRLTMPVKDKANANEVQRILNEIEFSESKDSFKPESNVGIEEFGLDKPRLTLVAFFEKGSLSFDFGRSTSVGESVYARQQGANDILVVSRNLFATLDRTADDLRDRALLDFAPHQAARLEIKTLNQSIELQKKVNQWQIVRPMTARADADKVRNLLGSLTAPEIQEFISDPKFDVKSISFDDALVIAVWSEANGAAKTLLIGAPNRDNPDKTYAKRKGDESLFTITTELAQKLTLKVDDLRDRNFLAFSPQEIQRIDIATEADSIRLLRENGRWMIKSPKETVADEPTIRIFLENLGGLKIKEFRSEFDIEKPVIQIALFRPLSPKPPTTAPILEDEHASPSTPSEAEPWLRIFVGAVDSEKNVLLLKRSDEPFVYGVDPLVLTRLKTNPLSFYDKTIFAFRPEDLQKLTIDYAGGAAQLEKNPEGQWQLTASQSGILDLEKMKETVHMLASLRAEELVVEKPSNLTEYGLERPEMRAFLEIRPSKRPTDAAAEADVQRFELIVGAETPLKRRYAMVAGQSLVFELDYATYNHLVTIASSIQPAKQP